MSAVDDNDKELTEAFMDRLVTIGIACGIVLASVVVVVIITLLACFIWRRKKTPSNSYKGGADNDYSRKEKSNSYVPNLVNATQPYYVQPSEDRKLAPSAEMLHYQYQKNLAYAGSDTNAPPVSQFIGDTGYVYEVPGLANQDDTKEVKNPLYGK